MKLPTPPKKPFNKKQFMKDAEAVRKTFEPGKIKKITKDDIAKMKEKNSYLLEIPTYGTAMNTDALTLVIQKLNQLVDAVNTLIEDKK